MRQWLTDLAGGRPPAYLLFAFALGALLFCVMPVDRMMSAKNDFVHWYVGGSLYGTPYLHDMDANQAKQIELMGVSLAHSYFIRPTFYGFFLKPLTWMPYMTAYWVFQAFSAICYLIFLRLHWRRFRDLVMLSMISPPVLANFVNGQDVMLVVLFCTLALAYARKGWDFTAGLILSLCAIKVHLFVFVPIAALFHKRWRFLWGGVTGGTVLFGISLLGGGFEIIRQFFSLVTNPMNHPYPGFMLNLRNLVFAITGDQPALLITLSTIVAAAALILIGKAPDFEIAFGYCLIAGLLVNFHAYIQDATLLLMAATLLMPSMDSKLTRAFFGIALTPIPYALLFLPSPYHGVLPLVLSLTLFSAAHRQFQRAPRREAAIA